MLGLIFLRFAEARFAKRRDELEKVGSTGRRGSSRIDEPTAYHAEGGVYLTPNARYDHLLALPEGGNIGQAINDAMADIEKHNPQLASVLPRAYSKELYQTKCSAAFEHVYEIYQGEGKSVYAESA